MSRSLVFTALLLPVFFGGCSKVRKRDLYVDLTVRSSVSGLPIQAHVELDYYESGMYGSSPKTIDLLDTDENGYMEVRRRLDKGNYTPSLRIYGFGGYGNIMSAGWSKTVSFPTGKKNVETVYLDPNYHFLLSVTNTACFDETDTVWITSPGLEAQQTYMFTGCADVTVSWANNPTYPFSNWTLDPAITWTVKVKRNGVVSIFEETFTMQEGSIVPVHIDY